jgi:hypothetical protein
MSCKRAAVLALLLLCSLVVFTGCAGTRTSEGRASAVSTLPDWVTIAMPEEDGRSLFVGGTSFAADIESGLDEAENDALSQVHNAAVHRFTNRFNQGIRVVGIETTPVERLDLKNSISGPYADRMEALARTDDQFYRPCGDDGTTAGEGPVCQVFVLVSVGLEDWDSALIETLVEEKRRRDEEGQGNLSELLEHMIRAISEESGSRLEEQ